MEIPSCSHEAFFPKSLKVHCDDMHFNNMIFCKTFKIASSILHKFCDDSRRVSTDLGGRRTFCEVHLPSIISFFCMRKSIYPRQVRPSGFLHNYFCQCTIDNQFFFSLKNHLPPNILVRTRLRFLCFGHLLSTIMFFFITHPEICFPSIPSWNAEFQDSSRVEETFESPFGSEVDR